MSVKMDKLIARLGITIRYGPAYSPWSNGIIERNYSEIRTTIQDKETLAYTFIFIDKVIFINIR